MSVVRPDDTVVAASGQVSTEVHEEVIVLGVQRGVYYGLDQVGTFIWRRIQQPVRVQDLVQATTQEYDVDGETAQHDIIRLLREMVDEGLVEVTYETRVAPAQP